MDCRGLDIQYACEALRISEEIYIRIALKAIVQTQNDLNDLKRCCQENDVQNLQAISHRLKGDFANLRIDVLSGIAKQLNDLVKEGYHSEQAEKLVSEFEQAFHQVRACIEQKNSR